MGYTQVEDSLTGAHIFFRPLDFRETSSRSLSIYCFPYFFKQTQDQTTRAPAARLANMSRARLLDGLRKHDVLQQRLGTSRFHQKITDFQELNWIEEMLTIFQCTLSFNHFLFTWCFQKYERGGPVCPKMILNRTTRVHPNPTWLNANLGPCAGKKRLGRSSLAFDYPIIEAWC